jgi:hypothetical protein
MFGKSDVPFVHKEQPSSVQSWREDMLHLSRELSVVTLESPLPARCEWSCCFAWGRIVLPHWDGVVGLCRSL